MTIRVGIDGSGPSRAALVWALHRAARLEEPVALMHVVDEELGHGGESPRSDDSDGARVLHEAVDSALTHMPGCDLSSELVHGSVVWSLTQGLAANDLIVLGTHKTGYLRGRVVGTRSIAVSAAAPCSVAVIPDVDLTGRHGIVIGVSEGDVGWDAVRAGEREATRVGEELTLVHAHPDQAASDSAGREMLAAASALAAERAPGARIRSHVSWQRPAAALLDASHDSSLLVLGKSRHHAGRADHIGSVILEVLLNINTPVYIARDSS